MQYYWYVCMCLCTLHAYGDTFYRSTFVAATIVILAATLISEANSSSCNGYDAYHDFECSAGDSIYRVSGRTTMEEKTEYIATTAVTQELPLIATELVTSIVGTLQ